MASFEAWFNELPLNRDLANFEMIEETARQAWDAGVMAVAGSSFTQIILGQPVSQGVTVTDDAEADVPTFVHSE